MADEVKLASGFPAADEAVWVRLVEKALDGKSPDRLTSKTEHGLPVKALYRETDWASRADASGAPGETPFVRGSSAERDPYLPWDIRQTIAQPDPALAAHEAMEALEGGVSSIELRIDVEGRQGIAVGGRCDLAHVLADVRLDLAPVALETTGASAGTGFGVAALLASVAAARGTQDVRLAFNLDPIGALVRTCALPGGSGALAETAAFARDAAIEFGGSRILRIDARPVHEAGGTEVQELAFLAAAAAEYLRVLITAGAPASAAARMILGAVSVGADYHLEIAKLRAARRILSRITGAFGATGVDMIGRVLLPGLLRPAEGVFVRVVGREASLEVDPPVRAAGVDPLAAILEGGNRRAESRGQGVAVAVGARARGLQVEPVATHADEAGQRGSILRKVAVRLDRCCDFQFKRAGRPACDKIDRAAQAAWSVEDGHIALRDLDLGDVRGQEAPEVDAVVGRQEHPHAVDRQRGLEPVEAADEEDALVAGAAGGGGGDAGDQVDRFIDRGAGEGADVLLADGGAA
jgi:hypothetical protein